LLLDLEYLRRCTVSGICRDGDGSALHNICTTVLDLSYGRDVEKIECANHAVKGYRSKLEKLAKDFHAFRGHGGLTRTVIVKIAHGAVLCACYDNNLPVSLLSSWLFVIFLCFYHLNDGFSLFPLDYQFTTIS